MSVIEIDISVRVNGDQAVTRDRLHDCPMAKFFANGERYIAWCASNTANRPAWIPVDHCAIRKTNTGGGVLGNHYAIAVSDAVVAQLIDLLVDNKINICLDWAGGLWQ